MHTPPRRVLDDHETIHATHGFTEPLRLSSFVLGGLRAVGGLCVVVVGLDRVLTLLDESRNWPSFTLLRSNSSPLYSVPLAVSRAHTTRPMSCGSRIQAVGDPLPRQAGW